MYLREVCKKGVQINASETLKKNTMHCVDYCNEVHEEINNSSLFLQFEIKYEAKYWMKKIKVRN